MPTLRIATSIWTPYLPIFISAYYVDANTGPGQPQLIQATVPVQPEYTFTAQRSASSTVSGTERPLFTVSPVKQIVSGPRESQSAVRFSILQSRLSLDIRRRKWRDHLWSARTPPRAMTRIRSRRSRRSRRCGLSWPTAEVRARTSITALVRTQSRFDGPPKPHTPASL